jgi:branched-chain amino acid transport system substrate-binding protein
MKNPGWHVLIVLIVFPLVMPLFPVSISTAQERTEILIGASLTLTGPLAAHGRDLKWAYERAVDEVNATGGIFVKDSGKKLKVRLVFEDNASNPMKAAATVEKLVRVDKVNMLLGGAEPTCVIAACIAAEKLKKFYHTAFGFPTPIWLEHKFKWSTNFFFSMDQIGIPFRILGSMEKKMRPKRVATVAEATFAGDAVAAGLSKMGKASGYELAAQIKLPLGTKDYSQQISLAKQAGVDAMLLYASVEDTENFVRGLKKNNYNVPYIHTWKGAWTGKFWKDLGKDAQYIVCDGFWSMDYPFEGAKELGEQYYEKFNEYSVTVGLSYALAKILFESIEKAGSLDGAKVRQAVLAHTFKTVMGDVKYNKEGLALFPQIAAQWWDGKQMLVYPTQYAIWEIKLAPAWDKR